MEEAHIEQLGQEGLLPHLDQLAHLRGLRAGGGAAQAQGGVTARKRSIKAQPAARSCKAAGQRRHPPTNPTSNVVSLTPVTHSMVSTRRVVRPSSGCGMTTSAVENSL